MLFFICLLFSFVICFDSFLLIINLIHVNKKSFYFPTWLAGFSTPQEFKKSAKYSTVRGLFSLVTDPLISILFFLFLVIGSFGRYESFLSGIFSSQWVVGIFFLGTISLFALFLKFPFVLFQEFYIEKKFGFSRYTLGLFLFDQVKQFVLGSLLLFLIYSLVYFVVLLSGPYWWFLAFLCVSFIAFLVSLVYPVFIAPIFNKFIPLEDGTLRALISEMAEKNHFRLEGVYVMDGSRRSTHQNAYFTGFGKFRRIVIFDTLIDSLTEEELVSVVAHEMGHWKLNHIYKGLAVSIISNFFLFLILGLLKEWDSFFSLFNFSLPSIYALAVILIFGFEPILAFLSPFMSFLSRKHEFEADQFAVSVVGSPEPLMRALLKLSRDNLSLIIPHPLYAFWYYSHPTLHERIKAFSLIK